MSTQYGKLCSVIISQIFGVNVRRVVDSLFESVSRTLPALVKYTGLTRLEVSRSLAILIKFRIVDFNYLASNENIAEYFIRRDKIIYILRYPKYVYLMQGRFGSVGATISEELLRSGCQTHSSLLVKCFLTSDNKISLATYREVFLNMINEKYLMRVLNNKDLSTNTISNFDNSAEYFILPEIDLKVLDQMVSEKKSENKRDTEYWTLNFNKFDQDLMDLILMSAVEKKLGAIAGECVKLILKQVYSRFHSTYKEYSNPFTFIEIKAMVEKASNNMDLKKYLDNYITLLVEDSLGFIRKTGELGGGQYVVDFKKFLDELVKINIENVITEKFGSKASRIFRVIKAKKYLDQEEIQKKAMIPAKEAKLLTYNLFQEQFIHIKTIRKPGGGGSGPAKSFFLFYLDTNRVVQMLLDVCFKTLYNAITRSDHEKWENKRLIDKSQKLESIVETMKEREESEEYIAEILETFTPPERVILEKVKTRIKILSYSELAIEDTIFLFYLYQSYSLPTNINKNNLKR